MTALSHEARVRLRIRTAVGVPDAAKVVCSCGQVRALLSDSDALAAAEARVVHLLQRDELVTNERDALRAQVATLREVVVDAVAICKHDSILAHVAVGGAHGTFGEKADAALASTASTAPAATPAPETEGGTR